MANTHLFDHLVNKFPQNILKTLSGLVVQSAAMGALPSIRAGIDLEVQGGQYFGPGGKREAKGYPVMVQSNEESHKKDDAEKLWEMSEKVTGVEFLGS